MKTSKNSSWISSGLLLPGCMFTGMGIGMLFNETQVGLFIGMGVGFLITGLLSVLYKSPTEEN